MRRWEYGKACKVIGVAVNQICAAVVVLAVVVCTLSVGTRTGSLGLSRAETFEETSNFQVEVMEQIFRCIRAASRESKFETEGETNDYMLVNIDTYAQSSQIYHGDSAADGLCYYLSDLLNWAMEDVSYLETSTMTKVTYDDGTVGYLSQGTTTYTQQDLYGGGEAISSSIYQGGTDYIYQTYPQEYYVSVGSDGGASAEEADNDAEDTGNNSANNETTYLDEESYNDLLGQSSISNVEEIEAFPERYAPVGYGSLTDYAEINGYTTAQLQNAYQNLQTTLSQIYDDYYAYLENLDLFSPSQTNMRYAVIPKTVIDMNENNFSSRITTNFTTFGQTEVTNREDFLNYIRSFRDYLIFDTSDMSYESSHMPLSVSEISSYLHSYPPSVEKDYILVIAIDQGYQALDTLSQYRQQFVALQPFSNLAVYGLVIGGILYILTMVYLTVAAGRQPDDGYTIHLNFFDRIHTEIALLMTGIPLLILCMDALYNVDFWRYNITNVMLRGILLAAVAIAANVLFQAAYLTVVRRLKAGTCWSNTLVVSLHRLFNDALGGKRTTAKTLIYYCFFLLINGFLVLLALSDSDIIWLLVTVLVDILVGVALLRQAVQRRTIMEGLSKIADEDLDYKIPLEKLQGDNRILAEEINRIGDGLAAAVEKSVKDERLKSDLITNVSHDIKTPLTSIINYIDLMKREEVQNERIRDYIAILEDKANRLKHLTEDLVEASKITSGNIKLELTRLNFQELIRQTNGEFVGKFEAKGLQLVVHMPEEPVVIVADGRRLWRVVENLYNNVAKYAMPNTRVYADLVLENGVARFSVKNISEQALNIQADELTERFIRGDVARSTEGSGLGLSIAKSLTQMQKGQFDIYLDGDLFKVTVAFPEAERQLPGTEEAAQNMPQNIKAVTLPETEAETEGKTEAKKEAETEGIAVISQGQPEAVQQPEEENLSGGGGRNLQKGAAGRHGIRKMRREMP